MWKILGTIFIVGGVTGILHNWIIEQGKRQKKIEEFLLFFHKSLSMMKTERLKVIDYFSKTDIKELQEIAMRLSTNTYAKGQMVWEEVFKEENQNLTFDKDTFQIILQAGNGFFGRSREENIRFLQRSINELEECQKEMKKKDLQERKIWIPVGVLGAVMLVIILI